MNNTDLKQTLNYLNEVEEQLYEFEPSDLDMTLGLLPKIWGRSS